MAKAKSKTTTRKAAKKPAKAAALPPIPKIVKKHYREQLYHLQIELVKCQRHIIETGQRLLIIFEGRDAAGKDGTIKRITEHLSPRETRVIALGKPDDRDRHSWYFQRYAPYLPADGEMVLFNRSWYNRAGVEKVMGFCNDEEHAEFLATVGPFEKMLTRSGLRIFKYYLDISRKEQARRMKKRHSDPLKQWKISPIDAVALDHFDDYSKARDEMLTRTSFEFAPWTIARADVKRPLRLNVICDILSRVDYPDRNEKITRPDHNVVFQFDPKTPKKSLEQ